MDEAAVLSAQAHCASAVTVDQADELLVQLAQRHLHDRQRALVGDAHTAVAAAFHAGLAHQLVDSPAAAVDDDRLHADQSQQRDVARESRLEGRIGHCVASEANHQRLAVVGTDVRQGFGEDAGFGIRGHQGLGGATARHINPPSHSAGASSDVGGASCRCRTIVGTGNRRVGA